MHICGRRVIGRQSFIKAQVRIPVNCLAVSSPCTCQAAALAIVTCTVVYALYCATLVFKARAVKNRPAYAHCCDTCKHYVLN